MNTSEFYDRSFIQEIIKKVNEGIDLNINTYWFADTNLINNVKCSITTDIKQMLEKRKIKENLENMHRILKIEQEKAFLKVTKKTRTEQQKEQKQQELPEKRNATKNSFLIKKKKKHEKKIKRFVQRAMGKRVKLEKIV